MKKVINTIVTSGGGVKGISYIGAFKKINEMIMERNILEKMENFKEEECNIPKFDIKCMCCVSVGSIMGLVFILGYTYKEMEEEILSKNFEELTDMKFKNFINTYGLDSGKKIINWIETLLIKRGYSKDITFKQLYAKTGIHYKVIATNLNKYSSTMFDYINTPKLRVVSAIRMSIGIPFIFGMKRYNGDIHVDGGIINNYPIKLFEDNLDNVLGLKLINNGDCLNSDMNVEINDLNSYMYNVMNCFIVQKERGTTLFHEYKEHTVCILTEHITHMINFSLTIDEKRDMIESGYKAMCEYFSM